MAQTKRKTRIISMRLTEDQYRLLDELSQRIKSATGFKVTRASIIQRLMHCGLPLLEKEFPRSRDERR
jgi:hypothetical protein